MAGGLRDRDTAAQMLGGVVVAFAEHLGEAEAVRGHQAPCELLVGERIQAGSRLLATALSLLDLAQVVVREAQQRDGYRTQAGILTGQRAGAGVLRPGEHRREVAVKARVGGQLDLQQSGRRRAELPKLAERTQQPRVRRGVTAEQVLDRRAGGDETAAHLGKLARHPRERVLQGVQGLLELSCGCLGDGERDQQLERPRFAIRPG